MALQLTTEILKNIADELDMGMVCFYHLTTGELESVPQTDDIEALDDDLWTDIIDKVESDSASYLKFEPMSSREAFSIMTGFIDDLPMGIEKVRLTDALQQRKPFQQFRSILEDYSQLLENWYAYKLQRYIEYVQGIAEDSEM